MLSPLMSPSLILIHLILMMMLIMLPYRNQGSGKHHPG